MSLNVDVTIAIPLKTVIAIQRAATIGDSVRAANAIGTLTSRAVVAAVTKLPYRINNAKDEMRTSDQSHSSTLKQATAHPDDHVTLRIQTLTGKRFPLHLRRSLTMLEVAEAIQDKEGIPPSQMCLIFGGKRIFQLVDDEDVAGTNGRTIHQMDFPDSAIVHLVLVLRGS